MDLLSMVLNARLLDMEGNEVGEVIGIHIAMGKLFLSVDLELADEDHGGGPDGGEEVPEFNFTPEDNKGTITEKIHAISGGKS